MVTMFPWLLAYATVPDFGCPNISFFVTVDVVVFVFGATARRWAMASSFTRFLDHTQRRTAVGRTPLYE